MAQNTVVNFHAVYNRNWLERVFLLLKKRYRLVTLKELEAYFYSGKNLNNCCHITFDDGDNSFYSTVFPLLQKHEIPASLYISPKATKEQTNFWFQEVRGYDCNRLLEIIKTNTDFGRDIKGTGNLKSLFKSMPLDTVWEIIEKYKEETNTPSKPCMNMTASEVKEVFRSGLVEIGAHTLQHPILRNESDARAEYEIKESINQLSDMLNSEIISFAYPNGSPGQDFAGREMNIVAEAGIKLAFSTELSTFTSANDPVSIPRIVISKGGKAFILTKLIMWKPWKQLKKYQSKDEEI